MLHKYTVKTETCYAYCWCVHSDKFVAKKWGHAPTLMQTSKHVYNARHEDTWATHQSFSSINRTCQFLQSYSSALSLRSNGCMSLLPVQNHVQVKDVCYTVSMFRQEQGNSVRHCLDHTTLIHGVSRPVLQRLSAGLYSQLCMDSKSSHSTTSSYKNAQGVL